MPQHFHQTLFAGLWLLWTVLLPVFSYSGFNFVSMNTYLLGIAILFIAASLDSVNFWVRRPVMFFGWLVGIAGPGIVFIPPFIFQTLKDVPVRFATFDIPIMGRTKDNIPLMFDLNIVTRVNPSRVRDVLSRIEDGRDAVLKLAAVAAIEILGKTNFVDVQGEHVADFSEKILTILRARAEGWGVEVSKLGIKNIEIDDESIKESMAVSARVTQNIVALKIYGTDLPEIASKLGMSVQATWEWLQMSDMNRDGKGGFFAINSGDQKALTSAAAALAESKLSSSSPAAPPSNAQPPKT